MTTIEAARALDAADPLRPYRARFSGVDDGSPASRVAYLDGNSLGRPTIASIERITRFLKNDWGTRLIRGWDEEWMRLPFRIGDELGAATLGASAGQIVVGDSTTVLLYKLIRAALRAQPGRDEIVADTDNFPTDRFVLQGIADECGVTLRWIETDPVAGLVPEQFEGVLGPRTALVVASHVAYRSGFLADAPAITDLAHRAGALVLWDVCHSVGVVPTELDAWGVDIAIGCTYKYLNGGPGAPAFVYVRTELQPALEQPIWGWMGASDVFSMAPEYRPADGMRRFLSGTPAIAGMSAMQDTIAMIADAGIAEVRRKSIALTEFAIAFADARLTRFGVRVSSPRDPDRRGSHVTFSHPNFREVTAELWEREVLPDFRAPDGLRIGLSPFSTSFEETFRGLEAIADVLAGGAR